MAQDQGRALHHLLRVAAVGLHRLLVAQHLLLRLLPLVDPCPRHQIALHLHLLPEPLVPRSALPCLQAPAPPPEQSPTE